MESLWHIIDIVGPLLLLAAIVWAVLRNRRAKPGEMERAERGARDLRRELENEEAERGER